ncbi:MAG: ParM/StbA family protein [Lachnospiraceae bacterium]|nr:ParM/StbA family protein [Lachnospiraceae bacterium]
MIKLDNGKYIIGFDNGYQFGKTANFMFDNGVFPLGKVEPSIKEHSLKFERKFYKVAEGRAAITEDKVSDENARLLTMVAIAQELTAIGVTKAEVILAVGLPFSDYGREKKGLIQYYEQKPVLKYEYEGMKYDITISKVFVFPQCYSAIAQRLSNMKKDYLVVDIGSKTTDVIYIRNGLPVESKSITIERAMVKWIRQIQGSLQIQYGKNIPENEILKVILKQGSSLPKSFINHIRAGIAEQIEALILELEEREFDLTYTNVIYVGGGAVTVKNFTEAKENIAYDCDILANAKGYEFLAEQMLRKQRVA